MLRKSLMAMALVVSIVSACAKDNDPPPAAPAPYTGPAPTAAQPLPQPAVTSGTPAPVTPTPAPATGTMATPNAFALPCTNDSACGLARCNVQFQKCAFPCAGPVDCAAGAACNTVTGLCLPGAAPQ